MNRKKCFGILIVIAVLLTFNGTLLADRLESLLKKGPVIMVENKEDGSFKNGTIIDIINAPVDIVWQCLTDLANYKNFMPKLVKSDVKKISENRLEVTFELDVPFGNKVYTLDYTLEPENHVVSIKWKSGDLKGSYYGWKLVKHPNGTMAYYKGSTRNSLGFFEKFEDEQQTMTMGINVSSLMAGMKGLKEKAEKVARERTTDSASKK